MSDWIEIGKQVVVELKGEPNNPNATEWRWGTHGSFSYKTNTGQWKDFEAGPGGNKVVSLVMHELQCDRTTAFDWLKERGYIADDRTADRPRTARSKTRTARPRNHARPATERESLPSPPTTGRRNAIRACLMGSQSHPIQQLRKHIKQYRKQHPCMACG